MDNSFCQKKGQDTDPSATCSRVCAADVFRDLSHFDITFPELGGLTSCLSSGTAVTGTCSSGSFVLGDGSCFGPGGAPTKVAKCETSLSPGQCLTMSLTITGELAGLGSGPAVVVDKESTSCTASCISGPSCERCDIPPEEDGACLTRTLGFWGTHPWITNNYVPVTVCGRSLGCYGTPPDGKSNPACLAGSCNSVMEGLGSIPSELPANQPYVAMVKQLTAAKLNLAATAALVGGSCSSWTYGGHGIAWWLATCDSAAMCDANKSTISSSGCIEALDAFNNSQDTGFAVTPAPFDRPPVDDFGNISGADPRQFTAAQGGKGNPSIVIGKGSCP